MLYILYVIITIVTAAIIIMELFREKNWRQQLAMVIILIPLALRIFQIK